MLLSLEPVLCYLSFSGLSVCRCWAIRCLPGYCRILAFGLKTLDIDVAAMC